MYQSKIFSFLLENYQNFSPNICTSGYLALFGIEDKESEYSGFIEKENSFIYAFKGQRIYKKIRGLEVMNSNIVEFASSIPNYIVLEKHRFDDSFINPFNDKPLSKDDFDFCYLKAIKKDDLTVGLLILLFKGNLTNIVLESGSLMRLFNSLEKEERESLNDEIKNIYGNNNYPTIILKADKAYLSNGFVSFYKLNRYSLKLNDSLVQDFIHLEKVKKNIINFNHVEYEMFYSDGTLPSFSSAEILSPIMLNTLEFSEFTFIFIESKNLILPNDLLHTLKLQNKKVYGINDLMVVVSSGLIETKTFEKALSKFSYSLIIDSNTLNSNMNIYNVFKYVYNARPSSFDIKGYKAYLRKMNLEMLDKPKTISFNKFVVKDGEKILCFNEESKDNEYIIEALRNYISGASSSVFTYIDIKLLKNRHFGEVINCFKNKNKNVYFIISTNNVLSKEELDLYNQIIDELNIIYYVDSSIFMNLDYIEITQRSNGIYFSNSLYEKIKQDNTGLLSILINYYNAQNKKIIIDSDLDDFIKDYEAYYMVERK